MLTARVGAAVAWTGARVSATGAGVSGARSLDMQYAEIFGKEARKWRGRMWEWFLSFNFLTAVHIACSTWTSTLQPPHRKPRTARACTTETAPPENGEGQ